VELKALAPEFFRPFFQGAEDAPEPFDFRGTLRGRLYVVKVVTGPRAFNSTLRRRVEEASYDLPAAVEPVVLTLQGPYFEPEEVGRAVWLSAPSSWKLVTGESGAYRAFRDVVFEEARRWRERAFSLVARVAGRAG